MWKHLVNYKAVWNFLFYFLFYFTILYWFCHTLTWIFHGCTWVPNPEPPSHHPPHPSLWVSQSTSTKHPVSCIKPRLAIHFLHDSIHVSMPISQILLLKCPGIIQWKCKLHISSFSLLYSSFSGDCRGEKLEDKTELRLILYAYFHSIRQVIIQ